MNLLRKHYPRHQMHRVCKVCCGQAKKACPICRKNKLAYKKLGLEHEINEFEYLRKTWEKCKNFRQKSCGVDYIDAIIKELWGEWHEPR